MEGIEVIDFTFEWRKKRAALIKYNGESVLVKQHAGDYLFGELHYPNGDKKFYTLDRPTPLSELRLGIDDLTKLVVLDSPLKIIVNEHAIHEFLKG